MIGNFTRSVFEKASFTGSAEPIFFLILCQICPVFHHMFTKFYQRLPKLTKVYQSLPNLANFTKCLTKLTKFHQICTKCMTNAVLLQFQIVVIYAFFSRQTSICKKSWLTSKLLFPTLHQMWRSCSPGSFGTQTHTNSAPSVASEQQCSGRPRMLH